MRQEVPERDGPEFRVKSRGDPGEDLANRRIERQLAGVDQSANHGRRHRFGA